MAQAYSKPATFSNTLRSFLRANSLALLVSLILLAGLYFISRANYLLFHSLVETFSVVISITIFALIWNSRARRSAGYLKR